MSIPYYELNIFQISGAADVGKSRHLEATKISQDRGFTNDSWTGHIEAACSEFAFSLWVHCPWHMGVNEGHAPDVGPYQVRSRPLVRKGQRLKPKPTDNCLTLRPRDKPEEKPNQVFVAVAYESPRYMFFGWMYAHEAAQPQYLGGYGSLPDAWFVPYADLHDMDDLPSEDLAYSIKGPPRAGPPKRPNGKGSELPLTPETPSP